MTLKTKLGMTLLGTFLFAFGTVVGQEAVDEEATAEDATAESAPASDAADDYIAVWFVIEEQWEAAQRGEREEWVEQLLAADFIGWPKNSPHPRDRASTRRWNDFGRTQSKGLEHQIYPLETVIHGDTAVAHYLYTNAFQNSDGETEVSNGRFTDILVRVDGEWKFIAWHGGDDDPDD